MTALGDYENRFRTVRFERQDGILQMTLHRDGGEATWSAAPDGMNDELPEAFSQVAGDLENRVVIFTGTGDNFLAEINPAEPFPDISSIDFWERIHRNTLMMAQNLLAIPVPIIGAVNGAAFIHAELIAMSNIVIASETAVFADKGHIALNGITPGDGTHVFWPLVLGPSRASYFLLTGEEIDAHQAKRLGFVAEVVPRDELLDRAWELARDLAAKPALALRNTRYLLTRTMRQAFAAEMGLGLALEALSGMDLVRGQGQPGQQPPEKAASRPAGSKLASTKKPSAARRRK